MAVITVIGAGNGAHALAADCKLGGAEVRMFEFTRYNNKVKGILNSRRIRLEGLEMNYEHFKRSGTAVLDMVTYDMAEAVHGADHILISVQAQGFQQVFEELAPLLEDGQTVSIFPDNFGSLILRRIMKEKGIKTRVIVAGYDSLVYGARLVEYNNLETETDVVNITYRENEIRVDTLPSCDYDEYLKRCKEIPALDATELVHGDTALDISISNVNPLLHIPSVVMNTGAIENWGLVPDLGAPDVYYDIYAFGCSPRRGRGAVCLLRGPGKDHKGLWCWHLPGGEGRAGVLPHGADRTVLLWPGFQTSLHRAAGSEHLAARPCGCAVRAEVPLYHRGCTGGLRDRHQLCKAVPAGHAGPPRYDGTEQHHDEDGLLSAGLHHEGPGSGWHESGGNGRVYAHGRDTITHRHEKRAGPGSFFMLRFISPRPAAPR